MERVVARAVSSMLREHDEGEFREKRGRKQEEEEKIVPVSLHAEEYQQKFTNQALNAVQDDSAVEVAKERVESHEKQWKP